VPPAVCRSPLRYEQQTPGVTHLSQFPENTYGSFLKLGLNGAQRDRYLYTKKQNE
jgi:hypothetical protein